MMRRVRVFAAFATFSVGAHAQSALVPLEQPPRSIRAIGFEVSPPNGENWFVRARNQPGQVTFQKQIATPAAEQQGQPSTFVIEVKAERYREHDLSHPAGLEAALRFALHEDTERFSYGPLRITAFAWQGTDCLRYSSSREERDVVTQPSVRQRWEVDGYFCRHPSSPAIAVTGLMQQRTPLSFGSLLDDGLRAEAEDTLQSVRFVPIR
jgi:hypothetical protein